MTRIPIRLRSNEENQLDEFVPQAIENLREIELEDEADDLSNVDIIDNEDGTFSAEVGEWATIISALRTLREDESLRSWWLRKKLARRLSKATEHLDLDGEEEGSEDSTPTPRAEESGIQTEATA
ncbi:hypothetical protein [Natrinema sp. DC36]|uniref:hypothetical protein n=1 Tax=Natrinema sp. DC36 TaxID=2878680 RepID=UPI001CF00B03|nr:hypothetical protein [Natrinema sp. DC36]